MPLAWAPVGGEGTWHGQQRGSGHSVLSQVSGRQVHAKPSCCWATGTPPPTALLKGQAGFNCTHPGWHLSEEALCRGPACHLLLVSLVPMDLPLCKFLRWGAEFSLPCCLESDSHICPQALSWGQDTQTPQGKAYGGGLAGGQAVCPGWGTYPPLSPSGVESSNAGVMPHMGSRGRH